MQHIYSLAIAGLAHIPEFASRDHSGNAADGKQENIAPSSGVNAEPDANDEKKDGREEVHGSDLLKLDALPLVKNEQCASKVVAGRNGLPESQVTYRGLLCVAGRSDLHLGQVHGLEASNTVNPSANRSGIGRDGFRRGPLADLRIVKTFKPLVLVASGRCLCASGDQGGFLAHGRAVAHSNEVLNKLNAETRDTICVRRDAASRVNRPTDFDVAVTEMTDVEPFHLGRLKFGPDREERFGQHLLASHFPARFALNGDGQHWRRLFVAVGHVLKMAPGGAALASENLSVLVGEVEEVGSEVHARITSNDESSVNTV